jgi:hypothetical protein
MKSKTVEEVIQIRWSDQMIHEAVDFTALPIPSENVTRQLLNDIDSASSSTCSIELTKGTQPNAIYLQPYAMRYWIDIHNMLCPPFFVLQTLVKSSEWFSETYSVRDEVFILIVLALTLHRSTNS